MEFFIFFLLLVMKVFLMIKPGFKKFLPNILSKLEGFNLQIIMNFKFTESKLQEFYSEHVNKKFFPELLNYMLSDDCLAMIYDIEDVNLIRKIVGNTDPKEAEIWTIRRAWGISKEKNVIHCSDSEESATREVEFFFQNFLNKK